MMTILINMLGAESIDRDQTANVPDPTKTPIAKTSITTNPTNLLWRRRGDPDLRA